MRKLILAAMIVVLSILVMKVLVLLWQNRVAFFPVREWPLTPAEVQIPFESFDFRSTDGVMLNGWYLPGPRPEGPVVLYLHGNGGNMGYCVEFLQRMKPLEVSWFLVDYRGYGRSEGKISEEGFYRDVDAAYALCRKRYCPDPERLILWGFSLGNVGATRLAAQEEAAGLILEAPFFNAASMAAENPLLQFLFVFSNLSLDTSSYLRATDLPKLFIHGTQDQMVPFHQSQALFRLAPPPKELFPVEGADHNNIFLVGGDRYLQKVDEFIRRYTSAAREGKSGT
jgi:fermentation-respiration switch protein FrsA (DUF1100 family)